MSSESLYVFKSNHKKQLVGKLIFSDGLIQFKYAKSFLGSSENQSINHFHLPLKNQQQVFIESDLNGILFVFSDALPGKWGKNVLEKIKNRKLSDFELLLEDQQDRVGDLVFNKEISYPDLSNSFTQELFSWDEFIKAKELIENHEPLSEKEQMLIKRGTSQGGARPKFCLYKDDQLYLVKMPSKFDYDNSQQIEHGSLCLARYCGINTVDSQLIKIANRDFLMVKRFDRNRHNEGIPYLSLASVCAIKFSENASYIDFAEEITRLGCGDEDLAELFKRMVFNILISNRDDHFLNHGLIFYENRWCLSPAFDVVAGEGGSKGQSLIVGMRGRESTLRNALSLCETFKLSREDALVIIKKMVDDIQLKWKSIFLNSGVDQKTINSIQWAILHDEIFVDCNDLKCSYTTEDLSLSAPGMIA